MGTGWLDRNITDVVKNNTLSMTRARFGNNNWSQHQHTSVKIIIILGHIAPLQLSQAPTTQPGITLETIPAGWIID